MSNSNHASPPAASTLPAMKGRTSTTDPLIVNALAAGPNGGLIGITFCPGKHASSAFGEPWRRDLAIDLQAIADWQAVAVVTLIEDHEFQLLAVPDLGARIQQRGMAWHHLPIADTDVPNAAWEARWATVGKRLVQHLVDGRRVVVHCRGGLGRAGTVAARLLIDLGMDPTEAMRQVRCARKGAIENDRQEQYVLNHSAQGPQRAPL